MTSLLLLLMLYVVFCPLVLSESGDDDVPDEENVTCSSSLSLKQSSLTCSLNDEPTEGLTLILCPTHKKEECVNATQGPQDFTFYIMNVLAEYELHIKPGDYVIKDNIKLAKIVKIPAPQIQLATYMEGSEETFISIKYNHDFVKDPLFQVEVLQGKLAGKVFNTTNKKIIISREILGEDGVYYIRVRAKPVGYFDGMWSEWSSNANFTVNSTVTRDTDPQMITYIFIIIPVCLVFIIGLAALRWRTHIKDYIKPNIPHPKATLTQIHRGKEGFPFIFSPEIFREVFVHRVVYVDEKQGLDEHRYSQASSASVCEMDTKEAELSPKEQSHLKIGLLNESDFSEERESNFSEERGGSEGVTALQRECKDEAYVTMSSLFKTQ